MVMMKLKKKESHYRFEKVDALSEEMEEENKVTVEVLRNKRIIESATYESDGMLFESLRKLQAMASSVEILKAMELEKTVDDSQNHKSKLIHDLVQKLINELKDMKDECHESAHQFVHSEIPSHTPMDEVWGLPSPPLDEGAFVMAPTSTMDLSKFFDGIDDSGNVLDTEGLTGNLKQKKYPHGKGKEMRILKRTLKQTEPSHVDPRPGECTKLCPDSKFNEQTENQKEAKNVLTKKVMGGPEDLHSNEASLHLKFECTKRKLREAYKQVENVKKQRRVQIIDFPNLPKEGNCNTSCHLKPKKFIQHLAVRHH